MEDVIGRTRYSEEQVVRVLRQVEAGQEVADTIHKHGISEQTDYRLMSRCDDTEVAGTKNLTMVLILSTECGTTLTFSIGLLPTKGIANGMTAAKASVPCSQLQAVLRNAPNSRLGSLVFDPSSPRAATVGSEEAPTVARWLTSVRRSNRTCRFPASGFHEDALKREDSMEGIRPTRFTKPISPYSVARGRVSHPLQRQRL